MCLINQIKLRNNGYYFALKISQRIVNDKFVMVNNKNI
jgi:hypothetical protein